LVLRVKFVNELIREKLQKLLQHMRFCAFATITKLTLWSNGLSTPYFRKNSQIVFLRTLLSFHQHW